MDKKQNTNEIERPVPHEFYSDLPLTDLVIYAIYSLEKRNIETVFSNLVVECFELFPEAFSLQGHPDYPDSSRVSREVQRLYGTFGETEGTRFVDGNLKSDFKLTHRGLDKVDEILRKIRGENYTDKDLKSRRADSRQKMGRVLFEVQKHDLYLDYKDKGEDFEISETLLRDILFSTMETPPEKLEEKMDTLIDYCDALKRDDMREFLLLCKKKQDIF